MILSLLLLSLVASVPGVVGGSCSVGDSFVKVFSHDVSKGKLFPNTEAALNSGCQDSPLFSRLDQLERYRIGAKGANKGYFHFKLCYIKSSGKSCNEWAQTSNPTQTGKITGFQKISLALTKNGNGKPWKGIGKSDMEDNTLIDDTGSVRDWWMAIGATEYINPHEKTIPGPWLNNIGPGKSFRKVELYVKSEMLSMQQFPFETGLISEPKPIIEPRPLIIKEVKDGGKQIIGGRIPKIIGGKYPSFGVRPLPKPMPMPAPKPKCAEHDWGCKLIHGAAAVAGGVVKAGTDVVGGAVKLGADVAAAALPIVGGVTQVAVGGALGAGKGLLDLGVGVTALAVEGILDLSQAAFCAAVGITGAAFGLAGELAQATVQATDLGVKIAALLAQVGTGVALDVAGAGLEVGVGVGGAALGIAANLTAWASVTIVDLAGCSAKLGVEIGMGAAGTAIGAFQEAADALGQLGGCVGVGGKCNLDYLKRPCFYKALSNRPKGASKQSNCIEGWKYFHHTKYCYKHFPHHVRFTDALAICSLATGGEGNLASAHDSETLSFFEGLASLKKSGSSGNVKKLLAFKPAPRPVKKILAFKPKPKPKPKKDCGFMGLGCAAKGLFGFGRKKRSAEPETDEENFYVWMGLVKNENKVWEWTDKTPVCYKGKSPKLSKNGKQTDKNFGKLYLSTSGYPTFYEAKEEQLNSFICQHGGKK